MPIVIRPATAADTEALIGHFQALNAFEDAITHTILTDRSAAEATWQAAAAGVAEADGVTLVAERDGAVVGFLCMGMREDDVYVRPEHRRFAHVTDLFVAEHARGQGVARSLMAGAEQFARQNGATRLTIAVLKGNSGAEEAYLAMGFAPVSTRLSKPL
jgi:GNAT superfamily N-acetyltransferase